MGSRTTGAIRSRTTRGSSGSEPTVRGTSNTSYPIRCNRRTWSPGSIPLIAKAPSSPVSARDMVPFCQIKATVAPPTGSPVSKSVTTPETLCACCATAAVEPSHAKQTIGSANRNWPVTKRQNWERRASSCKQFMAATLRPLRDSETGVSQKPGIGSCRHAGQCQQNPRQKKRPIWHSRSGSHVGTQSSISGRTTHLCCSKHGPVLDATSWPYERAVSAPINAAAANNSTTFLRFVTMNPHLAGVGEVTWSSRPWAARSSQTRPRRARP